MDSVEIVGLILFIFCIGIPVMSIINTRGKKNDNV